MATPVISTFPMTTPSISSSSSAPPSNKRKKGSPDGPKSSPAEIKPPTKKANTEGSPDFGSTTLIQPPPKPIKRFCDWKAVTVEDLLECLVFNNDKLYTSPQGAKMIFCRFNTNKYMQRHPELDYLIELQDSRFAQTSPFMPLPFGIKQHIDQINGKESWTSALACDSIAVDEDYAPYVIWLEHVYTEAILQLIVRNSSQWLGKQITMDTARVIFKGIVKEGKDGYPPMINYNIKKDEGGELNLTVWDEDKIKSSVSKVQINDYGKVLGVFSHMSVVAGQVYFKQDARAMQHCEHDKMRPLGCDTDSGGYPF